MRMAEILEDSHRFEKKQVKEEAASKEDEPLPSERPSKGMDMVEESRKKKNEVKKLNREELEECIKKHLCFKCGEKWGPNHQCNKAKVMCLIDVGEDESSEEHNSDSELSLNAMMGIEKSSTATFMASMGEHHVTLLVDSGSTHNFINTHIVTKAGLHGEEIEAFEVKLANGGRMRCEKIVKAAPIVVQGMHVVVDLYVLSFDELDVVLGDAWLKGISKIMLDYGGRSMEFTLGDRMVGEWVGHLERR